jgi:hypothetical protein
VRPLALRLLAVAAAIAMVVGALVVRNRMDEDKVTRSTELRLLCTTELEAVCRDLEDDPDSAITVTVEDAGATVDRLAKAGDAGFDGWLTPGPFPQLVKETRKPAGLSPLFTTVSAPIARTPVVVVMWKQREAALAATCGGKVDWTCLGNAASRPWKDVGGKAEWGSVKTALPDPALTAAGLVVLGAGTSTFFHQPDVGTLDIQENADFGTWLSRLEEGQVGADVPRMLAANGPSIADAAAGLEALALPIVDVAAARDAVSVIYPSPVASADAYLGTVASDRGTRLADVLGHGVARDALVRAGWKFQDARLQPVSYLPSPGLLGALRTEWSNG